MEASLAGPSWGVKTVKFIQTKDSETVDRNSRKLELKHLDLI